MKKNKNVLQEIISVIKDNDDFQLVAHERPDGDAIGSCIGLGLALQSLGKNVNVFYDEIIPSRFRFIEGIKLINRKLEPNAIIIALDCADKQRIPENFVNKEIDINIDHHATNENFGKLNYVYPDAGATAELVFELLEEMQLEMDMNIANSLLMGILTDTIGFRTSNTSAKTLEISSKLINNGANLSQIYYKSLIEVGFDASLMWGFALSKIQKTGKIIYTEITREDRKRSNYKGNDDADLNNILSSIEEMEISILFNEQDEKSVKVSWRSKGDINVSAIAGFFGGGGHPNASGAEVNLPLLEAKNIILEKTKKYLKEFYQ